MAGSPNTVVTVLDVPSGQLKAVSSPVPPTFGTASDIQPVGSSASAGSTGKVADAGHVHAHGNQAGGTLHAPATTSVDGFMSSADKTKLDTVTAGADPTLTKLASTSSIQVGSSGSANVQIGLGFQVTDGDAIYNSLDLDVQNHKIINLPSPISANEAATKDYVDRDDSWYGISVAGEPPEDFLANAGIGQTNWLASGTGSVSGLGNVAGHPGICVLSTLASATGRETIYRGATTAFKIGTDAWEFQAIVSIPTVPTAGEDFLVAIGGGETLATEPLNGLYFLAASNASGLGTTWLCCSGNGTTRTRNATLVTVTAGAWVRLRILLNAAGTSANFYINGTLVSTITTDMPGTTGMWDEAAMILKNAGTTACTLQVDRIGQRFFLTTPR